MQQVIQLGLPEISCVDCIRPIENTLRNCTSLSILSSTPSLIRKKIRIVVNDDRPKEEITRLIQEMLDEEVGTVTTVIDQITGTTTPSSFRAHLIQGLIGLLCGAGFMALSISGLVLPFAAMLALTGFSTLLTLYLGRTSYREMWRSFRHSRTLTMDSLFSISTLMTVTLSIVGLFVPWLPVMPAAGLLIFGFRHIGKAIEETIIRRIASGLTFKDRAAGYVEKQVTRDDTVQWEKVSSNDLLPGDVILLLPGQSLPVDGVCLSREATVDQSILNGKLEAVVTVGTPLSAGIRFLENSSKTTVIRVTHCLQASHLAMLDDKLEDALAGKAPIQNTTDKILQYFVPGVLILATVSAVIAGFLVGPALAMQCAAAIMVSACPCTLGFTTPLALNIGMTKAMENGVLFKDTAALESAGNIDAVVFDLNGTLTLGTPSVSAWRIDRDIGVEKFLAYVAALEAESTHATGREILRLVTEEKEYDPTWRLAVEPIDNIHHAGISAIINDEYCYLGNSDFMRAHGIELSEAKEDAEIEAGNRIHLAIGGRIAGDFLLQDTLREHAAFAVDQLKKMGKEVYICTGSDKGAAQYVARSLNIPTENVFSGCDTHTKSTHIKALKEKHRRSNTEPGHIAMIGDAGNDSLATVESYVGVAVYSAAGDTPTQDHAGAVAQGPSLLPVVTAFAVAEQTLSSIRQNLIISFIYNIVTTAIAGGALLAIGISITPPLGAALMVAQMLLLLANQYRIRHQNPLPDKPDEPVPAPVPAQLTYLNLHQHGFIRQPDPSAAAEQQEWIPPLTTVAPVLGHCPTEAEFGIIKHENPFPSLTNS